MMMKKEELAVIIEAHGKWFLGEGGAFRANLSGANLSDANLRDANLSDAKLIGANLIGANLSGTNLRDANLSGADLSDANLSGADLSGADLRGANLSDANLRDANLRDANLSDANLSDADLSGANLWSCAGERNYIKSIFVSEVYAITYTSEVLQIGCQSHEISEWWGFDDRTIAGMNGKNALSFWREWKDTIRMIIEKSPAAGGGK